MARAVRRSFNELVARSSTPFQALLHPLAILLLGFALGEVAPGIAFPLLFLGSVFVACANIMLVLNFRRELHRGDRPNYWHAWFVVGAALNGMVWGAAALVLFHPNEGMGLSGFLVPLVLAGFAGGYAASRTASPPSVVAFCVLALGPLVANLTVIGTGPAYALASILSLYGALLGLLCLNNYRSLLEATSLRLTRDRMNAQLRDTAATMSKVAANLPGLIFQCVIRPGRNGYFSYASDGIRDVFGLSPEDVREDCASLIDLIDPRDRDRVRRSLAEAGLRLQNWGEEYRVQHPQKGEIWVEAHATPERQPDGSLLWHGAIRETTEHRQLLDRIRVQAVAMDAADAGIVILSAGDEGCPIVYSNTAFDSMVVEAGSVRGRSLSDFLEGGPGGHYDRRLAAAFDGGAPAPFRLRFRRPEGKPFWAEVTLSEVVRSDAHRSYFTAVISDVSERLRIEADLKASEARYRSIVEDQVDLICRFKPDTTLTFVNPAYAHAFGRSIDELVGRPFIALLPASDRARALAHLSMITPTEPVRSFEYRVELPNGDLRWQNWTDRAIFDDEGALIEYQSIGRDVTDSKRMEAELRSSEERYRSIVEQHLDMIVRFTPDSTITFANEIYCRQMGISHDEAVGYRFLDHVPESDRQAVMTHYNSFSEADPWKTFEHHVVLKDGRQRLHQWTDRAMFDAAGRVVEIQSIGRDVTDDKKRLDRIRLLAAVFEATRDGVFVLDARLKVVTVNDAFGRITGYTQPEVVDQDLRRIPPVQATAELIGEIRRSIRQSGFWKGETWGRRKDGSLIPLLCSVNVIHGEDGEVLNYVGVFTDITRLKQTEQRLVELAHNDELTGLPNRRKFVAELKTALTAAGREGHGVAVHFLDLDDFKYVNDTYGHEMGDRLLVAVSERLRTALRDSDIVSRFGGDEFLILQTGVRSKLQASALAERVRACFERPIEIGPDREIFVETSIGISQFPADGADAMELIGHADAAAYQAKRSGKGSYQFYEGAFTRASAQRLDVQAKIRGALARREFVVYYQPVVDLTGTRTIGMEALVRWQSPDRGLVLPGEFIPIAEETGLIFEIDRIVLFEACRQMRLWQTRMLQPGIVSVNLSPRELVVDDTETTVRSALEYSGLPGEFLEIEVTETALMHSGDRGDRLLKRLKEGLGVKIAIDDFGRGSSSLERLHEMPVDKLKIDRSFVTAIDSSIEKYAICELMVVLAQKLGLTIQGEGVEREEEFATLRKLGCGQFQGFLFGKPMTAAAMEQRLRLEGAANDEKLRGLSGK